MAFSFNTLVLLGGGIGLVFMAGDYFRLKALIADEKERRKQDVAHMEQQRQEALAKQAEVLQAEYSERLAMLGIHTKTRQA
jgi:hypothetical protein